MSIFKLFARKQPIKTTDNKTSINKERRVIGTSKTDNDNNSTVRTYDIKTALRPIVSFDSIPNEENKKKAEDCFNIWKGQVSSLFTHTYDGWYNKYASIGVNNSLDQYNKFIFNRIPYSECASLSNDTFINRANNVITHELFKEGGIWRLTENNQEQDEAQQAENNKTLNTINETMTKFDIEGFVRTACLKALIYGGVLIYIDTNDLDPSTPLMINSLTLASDRFNDFKIIEPWQYSAIAVNTYSPILPHYMEPELYHINGADKPVHYTRIIPLTFFEVVDILKPMYNYLGLPMAFFMRDFVGMAETGMASLSDLTKRFNQFIITADAQQTVNKDFLSRVKLFSKHRENLGVLLLSKGEEITQLTTSIQGLSDVVNLLFDIVTATTGLPVTKFLGQTPQGFNATGEHDMKNHYDTIAIYQKNIVKPLIEKLASIICHHKLKLDLNPEYEFNTLDKPTEKEKAEIANLKIDAVLKAIQAGIATDQDGLRAIQNNDFNYPWINPDDLPDEREQNVPYGDNGSEGDLNGDFFEKEQ